MGRQLLLRPRGQIDDAQQLERYFIRWQKWPSEPRPRPRPRSRLRSYCLLSGAALLRDASVPLQSTITKRSSSFLHAYEDSGTAATTRGLHLPTRGCACRWRPSRPAALHAAQGAGGVSGRLGGVRANDPEACLCQPEHRRACHQRLEPGSQSR
jgi:hypothetical protein